MSNGRIQIYSGDGHGKSPAAMGLAIQCASNGESVVIIQFLKGKGLVDSEFVKRLEPEIKIFRFEKSDENFQELPEHKKQDEINNIRNGLNFARKVINTSGCQLLILDEVLGLVDNGIISVSDLKSLMAIKPDDMNIILTGITLSDELCGIADEITRVEKVKYKIWD